MKPISLRAWLWKALCQVVLHEGYANLILKARLEQCPEKDRALATRIFYGTLQNYAFCERVWKAYAKGKVKKDIGVLLTMSVYQLLFLDQVPAYAIIHEAVSLAKKKSSRTAGFVNAILRKIDKEHISYPVDPIERAAFETSLPVWLIRQWIEQYGWDLTKQFARASLESHPMYVRFNPLKSEKRGMELYENLDKEEKEKGFDQGLYSIQDPGSYEIALFAGGKKGESVLDICAAPGQKSFAIAERMEDQGRLLCLDLHESRVNLIKEDQKRLGLHSIEARVQDSRDLKDLGLFDLVLADVPCSGYGVLSRKPDQKLHLGKEREKELVLLQKELLEEACRHVAKKGRLVYSTCTLNLDENERQIEAFLKRHPEFVLDEQKTIFPDARQDGFYMARLRKEE